MLLAEHVVTSVLRLIGPGLNSESLLVIFVPLSLVLGAIHMFVKSFAMGFIIDPLSLIDIAITMEESAFAVCTVIEPIALIFGAVFPNLDATTLP